MNDRPSFGLNSDYVWCTFCGEIHNAIRHFYGDPTDRCLPETWFAVYVFGNGMVEALLVAVAAWDVHLEQLVMDTPDDQQLVTQLRELLPPEWRSIIDNVRGRVEHHNTSPA